ncbi:transcription elongation factor GreA [Mycoplasma haemofelis str. Langford 1]|uniref:Transcription elongation factor GreA n=2 Tax=Mycoplasma haemofelis TaxID=29501 RepID=F6FH28_MYCHI|nr:transcription elongation factor GreA [Mycoplasma haemofelis]AEG73737.1 transcription elongation factor GreA [Mycoplasma haemofelis Ohio2]CBY93441.1 transcription elongation factor GreA [Mycoplasma haemofelis str. Langford 1]
MRKHRLTVESLENLKAEYNNLVNVDRVEVIEEIKAARANGDLSENADYETALDKQKVIEGRIAEIKAILDNHEIISSEGTTDSSGVVKIGSKVKILEMDENVEFEYEILGSVDNNPSMGRISNECPLAKAMLGKKAGEVVEVQNIAVPYKVKILQIL